jgi:putative transposase
VRYRNSRVIRGPPSKVTVSCNGGKWFISIQTPTMVGIDLGVVRFATLSNGEMARRRKFSQNWRKAKAKVNPVYRKIAETRTFCTRRPRRSATNHAVVVVEDLKVRNLSKSAGGQRRIPASR